MRLFERLRIVLLGRRLSGMSTPATGALTVRADEICRECEVALAAAAALRTRVIASGDTPEFQEAKLNALAKVLDAFDQHEARIHDLVSQFHVEEEALFRRFGETRLLDEIEVVRRPATDLHARFLQDFMSLERLWQQWSGVSARDVHRRRA